MGLKIGVQMDHVSTIKIAGDTTFALGLEAQARGHELFHYTPDRLRMHGNTVSAVMEPMALKELQDEHYELGQGELTDLSSLDVVLLRQAPVPRR